MAAFLNLEWIDYLTLESAGTDLPSGVHDRIASLLETKVERAAVLSADDGRGFVWTGRGVVDRMVRLAVVGAAIIGGSLIMVGGRVGLGLPITLGGLVAWPFTGYKVTCRSCGARVSLLSLLRRSCGECGNTAGRSGRLHGPE